MIKSTSQRVKQSMASMLLLRPISAISGLVSLIILSRLLSVEDYGLYFFYWAVIEILILGSNCGLIYLAYRYIAATEDKKGLILPTGPISKLILSRLATLIIASLFIFLFPDVVVNSNAAERLTGSFVLLVASIMFFEGFARFIEVIFDAMLCQKEGQITLIFRTVVRVAGYLYYFYMGNLVIIDVMIVEVFASGSGFLLTAGLLFRILWLANKNVPIKTGDHWSLLNPKVMSFALPAFAAQLIMMIYGPDALKVVLANSAQASQIALFGFCYSLIAIIQRYIPSVILGGVFKPLFIRASHVEDNHKTTSDLFLIIVKLNLILILPFAVFVLLSGSNLLALISDNKYSQTYGLLNVFSVALIAVSIRLTLSMVCIALETSWPTLFSTILSSLSILVAFQVVNTYGAIGLATVYTGAELAWSIVCIFYLAFFKKINLVLWESGFVKIILLSAFTASVFLLMKKLFMLDTIVLGLIGSSTLFASYFMVSIFNQTETSWLLSVIPGVGKILRK